MDYIEIPLLLDQFEKKSTEQTVLNEALAIRQVAKQLFEEQRYMDAMERTVEALKTLRQFPDFSHVEFRALLVTLLYDLAEVHFALKNYKQSEKDLEVLFKVLDNLVKNDNERFGKFHILAMELSTRILRSRKKAMDLLVKQQINAGMLYDKVNAGISAATDKLVDSLRNIAQLLASTGDLKASLKFYAEAIKYSKKRTGRVTQKEIEMTIEMAEIMMRIRSMRPRAERLLKAVLPHAISQNAIKLEHDILALLEVITSDSDNESMWRGFMHKVSSATKSGIKIIKEKSGEMLEAAGERVSRFGNELKEDSEKTKELSKNNARQSDAVANNHQN